MNGPTPPQVVDAVVPSIRVDEVRQASQSIFNPILYVLAFGTIAIFSPFFFPSLIASWVAILCVPIRIKMRSALGGRGRASAAVTLVIIVAIALPVVAAVVPIVNSLIRLITVGIASEEWRALLEKYVGADVSMSLSQVATEHGAQAWTLVTNILVVSGRGLAGLALFLLALFAFLSEGDKLVAFLRTHLPLPTTTFDAFAAAYVETGRGLVIGVGGTAIIQGFVAGILCLVLHVPQPLALGVLTAFAALIPGIGTALVWGPASIYLALSGHSARAVIMALGGIILVGGIDNVVKPMLSKRAKLHLPSLVLFFAMIGGVMLMGIAGLFVGPLAVRLLLEALRIRVQEAKLATHL